MTRTATKSASTDPQGPRARLLSGLPVAEERHDLAGIPTAVLEGGEGPPLILLHGPGEFAAKWLRVIPDLVTRYRVIAPDLPAHGESAAPEGEIGPGLMLDWLDRLIAGTCGGVEKPALVGHALGGAIGARFAADRFDRLGRLVLVDSLGLARFRPAPRFALGLLAVQMKPGERTFDRFMRQCSLDLDALREGMGADWDAFRTYNIEGARSPKAKATGKLLRKVGLPPIPPEKLARIETPTSLIWGREDRAIRLRIAEQASRRYGWPLKVIDDCADDPARDRPEEFLRALDVALGRTVTGAYATGAGDVRTKGPASGRRRSAAGGASRADSAIYETGETVANRTNGG